MTEAAPVYYIRVRGKILGPFDVARLQSLRARGQFSRVHEISTDRATWQPASSIEHLFGTPRRSRSGSEDMSFVPVEVESQPALPSGPGGGNWYYHVGDDQHGPVSILELRGLIRNGQLLPDDMVWKDGMGDWMPAREIAELRSALAAPAPAPHVQSAAGYQHTAFPDGPPQTSGLAVASITLGILGLFFGIVPIFSLLAVIFAGASLKSIARSRGILGGRGMALTGLITGTIGLAFWTLWLLYWFGFLAWVAIELSLDPVTSGLLA